MKKAQQRLHFPRVLGKSNLCEKLLLFYFLPLYHGEHPNLLHHGVVLPTETETTESG